MFKLKGEPEGRLSWDLVLTATVPEMKDVATYATHPAHVAAAALIADCKESRGCVDYVC